MFGALIQNDYGQYDDLIEVLKPALGPVGLEHLKQRMIALSAEPVRKPTAKERQVIGWGSTGPIYATISLSAPVLVLSGWRCKT